MPSLKKNKRAKKVQRRSRPRFLAFVKLAPDVREMDEQYGYTEKLGPGPYTFFGDIPNMQGHCVVMNSLKNFIVGMHTDVFVELTDDET